MTTARVSRRGSVLIGEPLAATDVLLDLDGTLIDSRPAVAAAYRHAFSTVLNDPSWREADVDELLVERLLEVCERVAGTRAAACASAYDQFYREHGDDLVRAFPGARELIDGLHARGIATSLVTNKGRTRLGADLRRARLTEGDFTAIVVAEDTVQRKPHPAPIQLALRRLGRSPEAAIYVGDGPHDIEAATAAGVAAVGVDYGYYGAAALRARAPLAVISSPLELLDLVASSTPST